MKLCERCKTDISDRNPQAKYCIPCYQEINRERSRKRYPNRIKILERINEMEERVKALEDKLVND